MKISSLDHEVSLLSLYPHFLALWETEYMQVKAFFKHAFLL